LGDPEPIGRRNRRTGEFFRRELTREQVGDARAREAMEAFHNEYHTEYGRNVIVRANAPIHPGSYVVHDDVSGNVVPYNGGRNRPIGVYMGHEPVSRGDAVRIRLIDF